MPIIDKQKMIFIHIPKTAGTSIEEALIDYELNMRGDLRHWYGNINYIDVNNNRCRYELDHSTISYMINQSKFYDKTYFKFCVVRNPYERLASEFNHCKSRGSRFIKKHKTFKDFVYYLRDNFHVVENNETINHHLISHYLPQYKFTHHKGICMMDFVIRFETLKKDWLKLCQIKGLDLHELHKSQKYSSKKKYNYKHYYTDELRNIVYKLYKKDFEIFNYSR